MLVTRLIVGTLLIAVLVGLGWLDERAATAGMWLAPALVVFVLLATQELLALFAAKGLRPIAAVVYLGNLLAVLSPWLSRADMARTSEVSRTSGVCGGWVLGALSVAFVVAVVAEMARYEKPGQAMMDLAAAVFAIVYLGLFLSFLARLRLAWGIGALASLLIVVKMGDTGAYFFGKTLGRHRLAPRLSPSKTIEGAIGALVFSAGASWAVFRWLVPITTPPMARYPGTFPSVWGAIVFGVLVGGAGVLGDLAESLLKRDAARKDSSTWFPGMGGVLDMLDSVILAAPVAYACWFLGLTG